MHIFDPLKNAHIHAVCSFRFVPFLIKIAFNQRAILVQLIVIKAWSFVELHQYLFIQHNVVCLM